MRSTAGYYSKMPGIKKVSYSGEKKNALKDFRSD
jgi:hypothetical protein